MKAPTTTTTKMMEEDDGVISLSSTMTANLNIKEERDLNDHQGRVSSSSSDDSCSISTSSYQEDDCSDFSVKTHLDSVTSLPLKKKNKKKRQRGVVVAATAATEGGEVVKSTSVHFALDCNQYHENEDEEEYNDVIRWYQPEDYKQFKMNVIQIVKAVIQAQRKAERKREKHGTTFFSYSDTVEHTYNVCFEMELELPMSIHSLLTKAEMKEMSRLYRSPLDTECTLGLERLLVQRIGKDRSELRASLFHIVQDLQTSAVSQQQATAVWSPTVLADNICQISQEVSRPARLFAQHLAMALQQASKEKQHVPSSEVSTSSSQRRNSH